MEIKVILAALVVVVGAALLLLLYPIFHPMQPLTPNNVVVPTRTVTIGSTTIAVEVADTEAAREQGLSGKTSLASGTGMLFVFQQPGTYGFWMKDMNFSLDMIFADASGRIVSVDQDLSPQTYNTQNPGSSEIFYPSKPIVYVLEVPAGYAAAHGISQGMQLVVQ